MQIALVMFKSDGTRKEFPLKGKRVVIGRKNNCDLRIPLPSVSRQHCEIVLEEDAVVLRDLGSSNGTFHNDERVQQAKLGAGDRITVGPIIFTVVIDGKPKRIEPVHSDVQGRASNEASNDDSDVPILEALDASESSSMASGQRPATPGDDDKSPGETGLDDDDPIAALERLAQAEQSSRDQSATDPNEDSDELFFLGEEDQADDHDEERSKD